MNAFHLKSIKKKYSFILEASKSSHDLPFRFGLRGPIWRHDPTERVCYYLFSSLTYLSQLLESLHNIVQMSIGMQITAKYPDEYDSSAMLSTEKL